MAAYEHTWLTCRTEHGPFDGVLGYSSGAFMAALLVIRSLQDNPFATLAELPLRFAIFINNGLTPPRVRLLEAGTTVADCDVAAAAATDRLRVISRPDNPSPLRPGRLPDGRLVLTDGKYYITHHEDCIISIPTLHIYGKADNMVGATELVDLCKPEVTLKMLHAFGHDFPHGLDAVRKIARLIRQTAAMAS